MSQLLMHWLNNHLQLSTFITHVEVDFASGYLLGEILYRLNHQHNFTDFINSNSADAKIINYCLLEPSLRHLNIKFDSKIAIAIMNEKSGAAANLLYQIKMTAERLARAPNVSINSLERNNIQALHNVSSKLTKPSYDKANHYLFEHAVRRQVKSVSGMKREQDAINDTKRKKEEYHLAQQRRQEELDILKAERLHQAFIHSQYVKTTMAQTDSPAWRLAIQKKNEREQRKSVFLEKIANQQREHLEVQRNNLEREVQEDLDAFERRVNTANGELVKSMKSSQLPESGRRNLSSSFEKSTTPTVVPQRQVRDRHQWERRRKRFLQEAINRHTTLNTFQMTETLEKLVCRKTSSEQQAQQEMNKILVYSEVASENRRLRESTYVMRREKDLSEAVARDTQTMEHLVSAYHDDCVIQHTQQKALETARFSAQRYENNLVVALVMQELLGFAMDIAKVREDSMPRTDEREFLPIESWNDYRFHFSHYGQTKGDITTEKDLVQYELNAYIRQFQSPTIDSPSQDVNGINPKSPWVPTTWKCPVAVDVLHDNVVVGELVKFVRYLTAQQEIAPRHNLPEPTVLTPIDASNPTSEALCDTKDQVEPPKARGLRIVLFGPPFAGKKTQAKRLAETYNLAVLSVQELVERALNAVFVATDETTTLKLLGIEIQHVLSQGQSIPVPVYTSLVIYAIEQLTIIDADYKNLDVVNSGDGHVTGWVLYDLPPTLEQAIDFEQRLTGFINPNQILSPYDLESPIAPGIKKPALSPTFLHAKSGVDFVFYLNACGDDSSNDVNPSAVLERALGYVEDVATHDAWHLIQSPPPSDSLDRHRLRHENHTTNASPLLSIHCLTTQDAMKTQEPWYTQFNTLHNVPATTASIDNVYSTINDHIVAFFDTKARAVEGKLREKEELERLKMQEEEGRILRIIELQQGITIAQEGVITAQHSVQQAEEAKAKKEELVELKAAVEQAKALVETALIQARDWVIEENLHLLNLRTTYSSQLQIPIATALTSMWNTMEEEYQQRMYQFFSCQRTQRHRTSQRVRWMVDTFTAFVRRPDEKQHLVDSCQTQCNAVLQAMRFDDSTKQELHARVDMLHDQLVDVISGKQQKNNQEMLAMKHDEWLEDTSQMVAVNHQQALQAECDRFRVTLQLLVEGLCASSDDEGQLMGMIEAMRVNPHIVEGLNVRVFIDPKSPPISTPVVAPAAKGAKKPPLAPTAPTIMAEPSAPTGDPMSMENLMNLSFDYVLQRAEAFVQLLLTASPVTITPPQQPTATKEKTGNTPAASPAGTPASSVASLPRHSIDISTSNCIKAIKYEHDLFRRRVEYLRGHVQSVCDQLTRSMQTVEKTLIDVIQDRTMREEAAVASVLKYMRDAIEANLDLPLYININPQQVYRFPPTIGLREDTLVTVDSSQRRISRDPLDPPPVVEMQHNVLLNKRQQSELRRYLLHFTVMTKQENDEGVLHLSTWIDAMLTLLNVPHAFPKAWNNCNNVKLAKMGFKLTNEMTGLLNVTSVLSALSQDESFVRECLQ